MFLVSCSVEKNVNEVLSGDFIFQGPEINVYVKQPHNNNDLHYRTGIDNTKL